MGKLCAPLQYAKRIYRSAKQLCVWGKPRRYKIVYNENKPPLERLPTPESEKPPLLPPSPLPLPTPFLSVDVIERVADFLFEPQPPDELDSSCICCTKPAWADVEGFMNASRTLRSMGLVRWLVIMSIRAPEDWDKAKYHAHRVRELRCFDGTFNNRAHRDMLIHFKHLYAVSIDAHSDVRQNNQGQFKYQTLVKVLPPSLRRLEIARAHGPDIRIIATVKECCPNLEELRLGRCTIFNSSSACNFWRSYPLDHDSYMSSQDTDSYAHSLAQELFPLHSLISLHLGLYLIPSTTVLAHRIYHRRRLQAPAVIQWQQALTILQPPGVAAEPPGVEQLILLLYEADPTNEFGPAHVCDMCTLAVREISRDAEASANAILKGLVPSLEKVEWMSWFTPGHVGFSPYSLMP